MKIYLVLIFLLLVGCNHVCPDKTTVNIERLQKDVEKLMNDLEKLKDKVRDNGNHS